MGRLWVCWECWRTSFRQEASLVPVVSSQGERLAGTKTWDSSLCLCGHHNISPSMLNRRAADQTLWPVPLKVIMRDEESSGKFAAWTTHAALTEGSRWPRPNPSPWAQGEG